MTPGARALAGAKRATRALALAALALVPAAPPAGAQVIRAFTPRWSANQPGDITLVGNTIMTCSGGNSGANSCPNGRNGTGNNVNNNNFTMVYVDVDGDATTFSSSSADLALPPGATVLWAGLYWGGYSNNAARNTVRLQTPVAGYTTLTAAQTDANGSVYKCFADVTTLVRAGMGGTYRAANVYSTSGQSNRHGGWSLVVAYGLATDPPRNLVVFDGYALVSGTTTVNINVSGFVTPPAGVVNTTLGVVAWEGDLGYTGDGFRLNGTTLSDAVNPGTNFFNSSITQLGARFTAKNPDYVNQYGFDADLVNADGILPNGATSATITLTTNGDTYYPGVVAFSTELYAPLFDAANFTKTVTDVNGGTVQPGDVLEYTLTMRNAGQDDALACVMRDTLPANATYVPGSLQIASGPNAGAKTDGSGDDQMEYLAASRSVIARIGAGANAVAGGQMGIGVSSSVRFRVTVNAPAPSGSVVSNQGWLSFTGAQSGVTFASQSDGDAATGGLQPTDVTVTAARIMGTVFEDANYGGGAGRSLAASGGTGRPGARVELYGATGAFLQSVPAGAGGLYTFDGWPAGDYTVRVVNASVRSARPGAVAGLLPVQTFRTTATTGAAVAVTDRVGGENPAIADADSNTTSATLASLATAAATPQSIASVTLAAADIGGVDFGYNFDTIVSTRDAGQGTLRQFILNANALGNAGLAQAGLAPGAETSVFMIPDGLAHPGLRAGLANQLTSGVARIAPVTPLPALTDAGTRVDGGTQTANIGNTNAASLGGGLAAGVSAVAIPALAGPEVEIRDGAALALGLDLQGANQWVARLAITGFGNAAGSAGDASVRIGATANGARIESCVLGATATAWADPGAALRAGGDLVRAAGGDGGAVVNSLLGWSAGSALTLAGGSDGWTASGCEIRGNALGNPARGAVSIEASLGASLAGSWIGESEGNGIDARTSNGSNNFTDLTVRRNGLGAGAAAATAGIRLGGSGNRVERCVVTLNFGAGVQVIAASSANTITRNAISLNGTVANNGGAPATGQIGIDLQSAADNVAQGTAPYRTLNDLFDADAGGNALLNFPVLGTATLANGSFTITGWARPGATIELFTSDGDPGGFGEGQAYVTTFVEGSAADLDAGSSTYPATVNGLAQGADMTNRFRFTVPAPGGVAAGVRLTATATIAGTGTSEFSGVVVVATGVSVTGFAYEDLNHDGAGGGAEPGTGAALYAKLFASGSTIASQVVAVSPATGAYAFTFVGAGQWDVHLDTDSNPSVFAVTYPAGWIGTENPSGVRAGLGVNSTDVSGVNFGLWHGSRVDGTVFRDDGAAGGSANDGAPQGGEAGVPFARVRLAAAACAGGVCDSALTDGAGAFTLWLPSAAAGGNATVQAVSPGGWLATGGRAGTTGGAYDRAADAVAFAAASGLAYTGLAFGHVPRNTWVAPQAATIAPGGVAFYPHRFTAGSGGLVNFSVAQSPSPALPGWSAEIYRDLDCDGTIDAGEPVVSGPVAIAAGETACLVARHAAPAGAPAGAFSTATVTASFFYSGASPALAGGDALDDVTTVAPASGLVLVKSVNLAAAIPGDTLVYTIAFSNSGSQPISGIVIRDSTPLWTVFDSATCASPGSGITGCALAQPAAGGTGPVSWTLAGSLDPGGAGVVSYRVRVQ